MDVTCERCGTEYEFDETLVSDRGTTVKCTNCGHLFKVFRGGAAPVAAPADDKKTWTLRTSDESRPIQSLKELQRLISEGQVGEDDELSRSGEAWKRLGDIAELQTFFAAARAAATASPPRRDATARGIPRPPAEPGPTRVAPGRPGGKGTMMGMGGKPAAVPSFGDDDPNKRTHKMAVPPPASASPARRPAPPSHAAPEYEEPRRDPTPAPRRDPTPAPRRDSTPHVVQTARTGPVAPPPERRDATPSTAPPMRPRELAPTREAQSERASVPPRPRSNESRRDDPQSVRPPRETSRALSDPPPRLRVDDEDDVPVRAPRRSSSGLWVGLVVLLAAAAGVVLGWSRIQALLAPPEDGAATFVASGDEGIARDRDEGYRDAIGEYTKALALDDHDVRALVGLSRAHALLAQNRLFEASDLDARSAEDPALHGEASALRREATELTGAARENAEQAVRIGTGGADAEVVLADALRLSADPLARSRLDRARTLEPTPTAEALRVDALLTVDGASLAGAVALAEQAVAEDPGLLRARILLARAEIAAGDAAAARAQLQAVLTRDPDHPIARALMERLEGTTDAGVSVAPATSASSPPSSGGSPAPSAGPPSAGPPSGGAPSAGPPSGGAPSAGPPSGGAPAGGGARSYDALVAQAREILDNGNPSRARALYDQALAARPGGPEALTGVGFCMLAGGDANGALSRFRTAAASGFSEALIGMGDAYRRLGDNDRALEAYEQYLSRSPSGPQASIARRQADRLRASGAHGAAEPGASGGSGAAGAGEAHPAPETAPHELPAPTGMTEPPPSDTPAIDSEP